MENHNSPTIISHIRKNKIGEIEAFQSNEDHSLGVAKLSKQFASKFGMGAWGYLVGILHDKGKESDAFQQHIKKESGYDPNARVIGNSHHAYVGGVIARRLYGMSFDNFITNPIISHHSGLHDSDEIESTLMNEITRCPNKKLPAEINSHIEKVNLNQPAFSIKANDFHHLARMLYSCLVDADYLDTESFMDQASSSLRYNKSNLQKLLPILEEKLKSFKATNDHSTINKTRNMVKEQCYKKADVPVGFYSLTVPTGGGKTLSSLLWAMKHAIRNNLEKIIIAIPYK